MTNSEQKALLPTGLTDLLPPDADREEAITRQLLDHFRRYGYQRVKPPLLEFEDGLLDGAGAVHADQTFRVMDPASQRMLGVRADITPQIARITSTRLAAAPRPLRFSYSGEVLRVKGSQLRAERQIRQIGVELIGAAHAATGDAEVIVLAAEGLAKIGIEGLSVDINAPSLANTICRASNVPADAMPGLGAAIDRKDAVALEEIGATQGIAEATEVLSQLLGAAGPADAGLSGLAGLALPAEARALVDRLTEVVELVRRAAPDLDLTIDPIESRGFEYHSGISFTLFALGARGELGSGGRYLTTGGELATGFTLFTDMVLRASPATPSAERVFVPHGTPPDIARGLRDAGRIALQGLAEAPDVVAEARRLDCSHYWRDGAVLAVDQT
jgi:ATP phosphoribosyltransferase regulatory subunit